MNIDVLKPGLLTTLQDRGRFGCAMLGVGRAGPMDAAAMRLANALVGNAPEAAALEITLIGPRLRFDAAATIALAGAEFGARLGEAELPMWQPVAVRAGAVLDVGTAHRGARACLAVAGGFAAEPVLGSVSTDVNARLGGLEGRPLSEHDRLFTGTGDHGDPMCGRGRSRPPAGSRRAHWSLDPRPWFDPDPTTPIRLMRGRHFDALDASARTALFTAEFRVAADSNRVGYRLDGPRLQWATPLELVSEPLALGVLQLPPGGQPIALMAEHPTIGGYPCIGQVAAVDLSRLAQRRPGDPVRFAECDLDTAQTRYLERERAIESLIDTICERLGQ
jgi:antagonist of KipI